MISNDVILKTIKQDFPGIFLLCSMRRCTLIDIIMSVTNGSLISVYCDMEGSNCDSMGSWMRVAYLNMSEPNATCLSGLTQQ